MAKYYENEWNIPSHQDWTFRYKKVSPIAMMAMSMSFKKNDDEDFDLNDKIESNEALINFALEHIEYKVMTEWFPVKSKNDDTLYPASLEYDMTAMIELTSKFLKEVFYPTFTKSDESQKTIK